MGTGSLLTSSLRVVSGSAAAAAVGRETQPHENGRSTFYIDPAVYENEACEVKSASAEATSCQSDDLEQEVMSSGEDSGIDGKSVCDDVDCKEEALPAVNGVTNPAMALNRFENLVSISLRGKSIKPIYDNGIKNYISNREFLPPYPLF